MATDEQLTEQFEAERRRLVRIATRILRADTVGIALQVVLDRLTPAERVAFVLHDAFDFIIENGRVTSLTFRSAEDVLARLQRRDGADVRD